MKSRLIVTLEIEVIDVELMKAIKQALEDQADLLPETVKMKIWYEEYPEDN